MLKRSLSFAVIAAFAVMAMFGFTGSNAVQAQDGPITFATSFEANELEAFRTVMDEFTAETGIEVELESISRDMATVLGNRVEGGNPPDLANVPNPGVFPNLGDELVSLDWFLDTEVANQHSQAFLDPGTFNGTLLGVMPGASFKSIVWYNLNVFEQEGYETPTTLAELRELEQEMLDDGYKPWCIGVESGAASGWPGTDWMEDIALREFGGDFYDAWVNHDIPWTDDRVGQLFEIFGSFASEEKAFGGRQNIINTNFADSPLDMFTDPPRCLMHKQASFALDIITSNSDAELGEDFSSFVFPKFGEGPTPVLFAGDLFIAFKDSPEIRQLIEFWASAEAQGMFAELNPGRLAVNSNVGLDVYPNDRLAGWAQALQEADVKRYDGSDMMPAAIGSGAFWTGVLDYLSGVPVDEVQQQIETAADDAYTSGEATD